MTSRIAFQCPTRFYLEHRKTLSLGASLRTTVAPETRVFTSVPVLLAALKACSVSRDLETGRRVHRFSGQVADIYVSNTLIDMYARCGSMVDARNIFDSMESPDLVSWNALIRGYATNGEGRLGLELFSRMTCEPDARSFVAALMACSSQTAKENGGRRDNTEKTLRCLQEGREIHARARKAGSASNVFVASALVDMYAKCGSVTEARLVFDGLKDRNVVSWTSLMLGYVDNGEPEQALDLFQRMQHHCSGCPPNSRTFVAALMACASLGAKSDIRELKLEWLNQGALIHSQAVKHGFGSDVFVASSLVDMYSKCGGLSSAIDVFESTQHRDVILWNAMIQGYVEAGDDESALELFSRMDTSTGGCKPDARTYVAVLMACSSLGAEEEADGKLVKSRSLSRGVALHRQACKYAFESDKFVASSLVDMYTTCGSLADARAVFDKILHPDVVLWNALMLGYVQNGASEEALRLFSRLQGPDPRSYVAAFMACASLAEKEEGQEVREEFVKLRQLEQGMAIHAQARERGCDTDMFVASSLVEMYSKCGSLGDARLVFDRMKHHDVVLWTALVSGYAENGDVEIALELVELIQSRGCEPNSRTFIAALVACGSVPSLEAGKELHARICRLGLEAGTYVASSLVDLYGKCARLDDAERVFESLARRMLVVTWSSLMASYSRQGDTDKVLELFERMLDEGLRGDRITFVLILTSCSHAGLVDTGKRYFEDMKQKYGVEPDLEHYHCVVDLLARANHLDEALEFVKGMPVEANLVTWKTVLAGCKKWNNLEIGRAAFQSAVDLDPRHEASYVLMANLYGSLGMWEEQLRTLELKEATKVIKSKTIPASLQGCI
ncbi:pentatricopeptide repeat-containing protein At4g39530-like [Selaginella moellendorffii]|uniref:pentatricopeptide repeat-containing protein At4g39530-like n=1 Tax=Selaginella moellendorffii TaxID=88036 RepID=UPI000D1C511A|nr:pentatricopeptide repeat-containing protein At4g39530-like [Selaginella moellendorffii]XP_024532562.1 pentatricopeptide repeat-containing protein At4g39530-like [Selaginella moellendorffii]|eukprot:XP_024532561.1 pentatricopeptide repeat-containing protein At4g39530-like [Selaginella moellendorffii]